MSRKQDFRADDRDLSKQIQIIEEAFCSRSSDVSFIVTQELLKGYPHKALVKGKDDRYLFRVEAFAKAGGCTMLASEQIQDQRDTLWNERNNQPYQTLITGSLQISWQGNQIDVILICSVYYWILADTREIATDFFSAVCQWSGQIRSDIEILEYKGGGYQKSRRLHQAIKNTTFDNLVLEEQLKRELQNLFNKDLVLASIKEFEEMDVLWKRGYLFYGSPGNGKTHAIKAIVNQMQLPCLYVRSFDSYGGISQDNIDRVFQGARRYAPCILVLEDIDSLVNEKNRSFFLNEVDGFGSNHGIVIIATTNYPERLDPAIMRASRFDKKYPFDLPGSKERDIFLQLWNETKLKSQMRLSSTATSEIAELTHGFSFAYLRELILSSKEKWMETRTTGEMDNIMVSQVPVLRQQISLSDPEGTNNNGNVKQFSNLSLFKKPIQEE